MASHAPSLPLGENDADRIIALLEGSARTEGAEEGPSREVIDHAITLISNAAKWMDSIPEPIAVFAMEGGIHLAWRKNDSHLRIVCAPEDSKSYLYTSETVNGKTSNSSLTHLLNTFTLIDGFEWLQKH